jgi:hypothetical protein
MLRWIWPAVLVLATTGGLPGATPDLVERALASMENADPSQWAYTETMVQKGTTVIHRHDPTRPEGERWLLVSVDDRPPTEKERAEYAERRARETETQDDDDRGIRAMIAPGSLNLIGEDPVHATYAFDPVTEDSGDAKLYEHLDATLRVVKEGPYVDRIELGNPEPFSPGFGLKVKQFSTVMTFAPQGEQRSALPHSESFRLVGRALLVKKVDVDVELTYDDYRFGGD